jgi:hypothetical protein
LVIFTGNGAIVAKLKTVLQKSEYFVRRANCWGLDFVLLLRSCKHRALEISLKSLGLMMKL